jgi:hypothetical protein
MSILFTDGFDDYYQMNQIIPMPRQKWWRRWLRLKRPAGPVYLTFKFKFKNQQWETAEAWVDCPKGVDAVKLNIQVAVDGTEISFSQ